MKGSMTQEDPVKIKECNSSSQMASSLQHFTVVKRNGSIVPFRRERILRAIECAFRDTKKVDKETPLSPSLHQSIDQIVTLVVEDLYKLAVQGTSLTVEGIQDQVEVCLMKAGHHDVARDYIIYRDQHKALRDDSAQSLKIIREDGIEVRFNPMKIASSLEKAFRSSMEITGFSPKQVVEAINLLTQNVVARALSLSKTGVVLSSILIEDEIEQQLMKADFYSVAKHFILHRALLGRQNELKFSYPIPEDRITREFTFLDQEQNKRIITEKQLFTRIKVAAMR